MNNIKHIYKLIVIGNSNSGKSTLCNTYCYNTFTPEKSHTIGVSYLTKNIKDSSGNDCKITLWDTAGQERFQSIVSMYFKNVSGVICMFDTTNKSSLNDCEKWLIELEKYNTYEKRKIVLVGSKVDLLYPSISDLDEKRKKCIEYYNDKLEYFKEKYDIKDVFIISIKDENINNIFECLMHHMNPVIIRKNVDLHKSTKTNSCKCF
jgi:small GTP-binding protein